MHWQMNACGGTGELVGCVWKPTRFVAGWRLRGPHKDGALHPVFPTSDRVAPGRCRQRTAAERFSTTTSRRGTGRWVRYARRHLELGKFHLSSKQIRLP
jgi:hypothetical protein